MFQCLIFRRLKPVIAVTALIFMTALPGAGQDNKPSADDTAEMLRLHKMSGKLLARGANQEPTGKLKLRSYILEELTFAKPIQTEIDGQSTEVNRAWRLTITSSRFAVRAMPAFVLIDDNMVGIGVESSDLTQISVIIFDQKLLRDGATISISYERDYTERNELPEKLKFNPSK